jgi:hypothetical protein
MIPDIFLAGAYSKVVDMYNQSSSSWSTAELSLARGHIGAASVAGVAIFAAGRIAGTPSRTKVVDYFDVSAGLWTTGEIPGTVLRDDMATSSLGNLAFFTKGTAVAENIVCVYPFREESFF